jgi:hypothetical protein
MASVRSTVRSVDIAVPMYAEKNHIALTVFMQQKRDLLQKGVYK